MLHEHGDSLRPESNHIQIYARSIKYRCWRHDFDREKPTWDLFPLFSFKVSSKKVQLYQW